MMLRQSATAAILAALFASFSAQAAEKDFNAQLAGAHMKKGFDCATCHVDGMKVSDSEKEINKQCVSCHGGLEKLADPKKTPDPHASHIGTIQCTACHAGHVESQSYCLSATTSRR